MAGVHSRFPRWRRRTGLGARARDWGWKRTESPPAADPQPPASSPQPPASSPQPPASRLRSPANEASYGEARQSAEAAAAAGPDALVIEFTDTGIGMDPEAMAKVFEPYFSTKAAGTGLGLTIAKRNVELNGGTIEVRSQKGVGTTVTITLPVQP